MIKYRVYIETPPEEMKYGVRFLNLMFFDGSNLKTYRYAIDSKEMYFDFEVDDKYKHPSEAVYSSFDVMIRYFNKTKTKDYIHYPTAERIS